MSTSDTCLAFRQALIDAAEDLSSALIASGFTCGCAVRAKAQAVRARSIPLNLVALHFRGSAMLTLLAATVTSHIGDPRVSHPTALRLTERIHAACDGLDAVQALLKEVRS